jgi:hypothetical protein
MERQNARYRYADGLGVVSIEDQKLAKISFCVGLAETAHFSPSFLHHTSISMFHEDNRINYFTNVTGKVPY